MNFNEYQKKAISQRVYPEEYKIIYPALGLGEEAGEVMGKIKKWLRGDDGQGKMTEERIENIKLELGDVLWYIANISEDLGISLDDVARANVTKIESRRERGVVKGEGDKR